MNSEHPDRKENRLEELKESAKSAQPGSQPDTEGQDSGIEFLQEEIKKRPLNRKKMMRRMTMIAVMAAVFGAVACLFFLLLEPIFNRILYPEEAVTGVTYPEETETEEMTPEEMLINEEEKAATEEQERIREEVERILRDKEKGAEAVGRLYGSLWQIAEDARWFNSVLEKTFKTHVLFTPESVANKEVFTEFKVNNNNVKVEDLTKGRVASRIGVAVLSIASYCVCASAGIPPIIGSTGIGTGGSIVSEGIFKKKLEEQKENLRAAIRANVPMIIGNATAYSEGRIKNLYNDIINEAKKQEEKWNSTQDEAIKASTAPKDEAKQQKIEDALEMLAENVDKLNKYIED